MALMILKSNKIQWMTFYFFSSHSDTELATWDKRKMNLPQFEPVKWGSLFEHGQLSMILFWLTWDMDQPLHCTTLFSAKIEIFWPAEIALCLHEQKKINFDLRAFTWSQNYQNQVRYARWYQRRGPFLKLVLILLKSKKAQ